MTPKLAAKPTSVKEATMAPPEVGAVALSEWKRPPFSSRARRALSFRNMSAVYLFVLMFIVFAIWVPSTFLASGTWRSLISDQAITCLIAVGVVPALAAGVFDLAVGAEVGLGAILVAWLLVDEHASIPVAIVLTLLAGVVVGGANSVLITRARIPSFIATLGVSSVLLALIQWISGGIQILSLPAGFQSIGNDQVLGLQLPVYIMLVVAAVVWFVLERTPAGRGVYAAGADPDAARLAGVRVSRVILCAAAACAVIAGLGGLLESAQLATGDPTIGPGYLLPTYAAVFLGSTQFRSGRMNVWGTVVAAYVIATGVKGLQLAGLPIWVPDMFDGVALLFAVGLAAYQKSPISTTAAIRRLLYAQSRSVRSARRARRADQLTRVRTDPGPLRVTAGAASSGSEVWMEPSRRTRVLRALSFRNISAIYLFVLIFVIFAIWVPTTFLASGTWRSLISDQAITCIAAVALVPVIAAGVVDLAVGTEVGLGAIVVAWLLVNHHVSVPLAIVLTLLCGGVVGVINWALITRLRIPPFIATLGMSSVLLAVIAWVSGGIQILSLPSGFQSIGNDQILGLQLPVYILLVIALVMWYVLERTPAGRCLYATGADPEAARLAGIRTSRVILLATVACAVIAGVAGMLESSQLATGDPTIGPGYLLPAIAAAFLGSTQFRNGRMNVWGTVLGAYVIATGVKGVELAGLPIWVPDFFNGAILLAAVALAQYQGAPGGRGESLRKLLARRSNTAVAGQAEEE
ncbi:MAG TPA: ABC transporter permease [Solirubrobacteraceae bacterium]|nr:ABC transporter permease [Solirubrobacteraceae bacterium]